VPYAALAVVIVTATVVTLVLAVYGNPRPAPAAASPSATPIPTAPPRALTDLSANGRLAYWRDDLAGNGYQLWVANTDNSRRRAIARTAQPSLLSETRWSSRGDEVGYVENGVRLVVARVDGVVTTYTLAPELRVDGWHITDHRFSPSGDRVAATVQRASGAQTDVFLANAGGTFQRLTTTEDVVAADWIGEDELLVNTTAGLLARLRVVGTNQLRPITSLPAATPVIGADGRIYFLSGRVAGFAGTSATLIYAAAASIWSVTIDGGTPRLERTFVDTDSRRLDGFWPGGYLVHRGGDAAQQIAAPLPITIPAAIGTVERLRASSDGTYAIGIVDTNVVRFDLSTKGDIANGIVLLGSVAQADAWFPRTGALAQAGPPAVALPAGSYAFALGGSLWIMSADGVPTLLRPGNTNAQTRRRFTLPPPVWSPNGDRVLTIESLGSGASSFQLVPVVISIDGQVKRYTVAPSVAQHVSWSPDGQRFAVVSLAAAASDPAVNTSELQVQILDTAGGGSVQTIPGREAHWTTAGIVLLTNGIFQAPGRARDEQTLVMWKDGETRTITTIDDLRKDSRAQAPSDAKMNTLADRVSATGDGTFVSVHLTYLSAASRQVFAIVRASDGVAPVIVASEAVSDELWSPSAPALGYTQTSATLTRAVVRDAASGSVLLDEPGRFAGWSADGAWVFVARDTGLYTRRIAAAGDLLRVSAFGVSLGVGR